MADHASHLEPEGKLALACSFAYYLPQFHIIPENEEWWGKGFTEWTKLRAAQQVHPDQIIQHPGELGFYDLSDVSVIGRQYALARSHGISTFAFWHYWFGDEDLLLEKPAEALLASDVDARFCMAWANHDWMQRSTGRTLRKQTYSKDSARHFAYLEPFFHDARYRKIDGCPVFFMFSPSRHPYLSAYVEDMQKRAEGSGFPGIAFIFDHTGPRDDRARFCDWYLNSTAVLKFQSSLSRFSEKIASRFGKTRNGPQISNYAECVAHMARMKMTDERQLPVAFPGWDTSIRHGDLGQVLLGNTPELFGASLDAINNALSRRTMVNRMFVVKSWNEWAEGNLLEPTAEYGRGFLEEVRARFTTAEG